MVAVKVTVGVHPRKDGQGFLVKVTAEERAIKFPTETEQEAVLLAESIRDGLEVGIPLEVLMPSEACVPVRGTQ